MTTTAQSPSPPSRRSAGATPASPDPIAFAGGALDRAGLRRTDAAWLDAARRDPAARAIVVGRAGAHPEPLALREDDHDDGQAIFLGIGPDGGAVFAIEREGVELTGLRDLAASLPGAQLGTVAYATGMANWARATRFCGNCGTATEPRDGGHVRVCANGHQHHPRTDPVVIMLVTDGDRCLLGRQTTWPAGRYSALAGFVEPGERLEDAVAREVLEESGIVVDDVRYLESQPWPFPVSLMLGFFATYVSGEPVPGDGELEDVRWYSREEIVAAISGSDDWIDGPGVEGLMVPPPTAIARTLLDRWIAQ
ncbi:NAD(+) diphosphatase [Baekduia sp.]|uniref:NAD(+) diphosphatase n=1 Tax=Baekduia sp. TaxID=2600305 RepID=UPI002E08B9DE|nr:NAD(+) diphosphatase [Baekduia sp.]